MKRSLYFMKRALYIMKRAPQSMNGALNSVPYVLWKQPYTLWKEPYALWKESYILTKEPYVLSKGSYLYICIGILYMYVYVYIHTYIYFFECCFKAQSSKLQRLFCHVSVQRDVRALSFEPWRSFKDLSKKMSPQVNLAVYIFIWVFICRERGREIERKRGEDEVKL